jgi:hypothetical protein
MDLHPQGELRHLRFVPKMAAKCGLEEKKQP